MEESAYMFYQLIFIVSDFSPNTISLGKIRRLKKLTEATHSENGPIQAHAGCYEI
jgi:hypothetical protein